MDCYWASRGALQGFNFTAGAVSLSANSVEMNVSLGSASTESVKVGPIKIRFELQVLKVGPGILPERPMKQQ